MLYLAAMGTTLRRLIAVLSLFAVGATISLSVNNSSPAVASPRGWIALINGYRAEHGLPALTEHKGTSAIARTWTQTMAADGRLSHNPLLGQQLAIPWTRLAENVASGYDEESTFKVFTTTAEHRANLLGPYNGVGVAHIVSRGKIWTTHIFVEMSAPLTSATAAPAPVARSGHPSRAATEPEQRRPLASDRKPSASSAPQRVARASAPPAAKTGSPVTSTAAHPAYTGTTVAATRRPTGGMWLVSSSGKVRARGGAPHLGQVSGALKRPVVGIAASRSGNGYWLATANGGVLAYGDARFHGSAASIPLNKPVVGIASTPTGGGYWLVAADGGVFPYGDAPGVGSAANFPLKKPVVGIARTPSGKGYWLVAGDGGVFAYGDARYLGDTSAMALNKPIVGIASTPSGRGYWLIAGDGTIFPFGDAPRIASLGRRTLPSAVVAMVSTASGRGYCLVRADGWAAKFGDASC